MAEETVTDADMVWYSVEEKLEVSGKEIDTGKGKSFMCGFRTSQMSFYKLRLKVKVDASELAQVPVSIFVNGKLLGTHTLNGTGGEFVEIEQPMCPFFNIGNYLKLYFAESGMQIEKMIVEKMEKTLL
ncbi:MAG: hypothetical protein HDR27_08455 [Lachnospiraceae bacterium]|nr:hypothetical protein [Lachnospiraceae bacterium]